MKKLRWFGFVLGVMLSGMLVARGQTVEASGNAVTRAAGNVVASAVIVPARVARLAFTISAPVKEVLVQEGEQVKAGQELILLNVPDLEYAVTAAEAHYRGAQANALLQRAKMVRVFRKGKFLWVNQPREYRERAYAQALQAQAALDVARAALAESRLVAPFDGTVTALQVTPGEFVQVAQAVLVLATLDDWRIETTDLSERDIRRVQVGQTAMVKVEALGVEVPAVVMAIAPRADVVGGDVVFQVTLRFASPPPGLRWGMSAEVQIAVP